MCIRDRRFNVTTALLATCASVVIPPPPPPISPHSVVYPSNFPSVVLYLNIPAAGVGLSPVVPTGTTTASVLLISSDVLGVAELIPTVPSMFTRRNSDPFLPIIKGTEGDADKMVLSILSRTRNVVLSLLRELRRPTSTVAPKPVVLTNKSPTVTSDWVLSLISKR